MSSFAIDLNGQLLRLEEFDPRPLNVNQSRLQFFLDCKRKYYWQFELGLVPDRPRWALEDGKAFHEGMAHMAAGHTIDEAVSVAVQSLRDSLPKQKLMYDEVELREHAELVEKILRAYDTHYKGTTPYTPLGIECSGRVEIGEGSNVFLVFRTDRLANWVNRVWIVDHKTAAKLDMRDVLKYEMDLQFTAYTYGVTKILGQRAAGVIVDIVTKTKVPSFHQQPFVRSDDELLDFEQEFIEMGRELQWRRARVRAGEDPKVVFYKNTKECFRYGTCPYRDLCLEDTNTKRMLFKHRDPDYVDEADRSTTPSTNIADLVDRLPPSGTGVPGGEGAEPDPSQAGTSAPGASQEGARE